MASAATDDEELLSRQYGVVDEENDEWIDYPSPTDALIAKLHLESRVPASHINLFLDVLHNPYFDLRKLAFKSCSDIDRSVAAYRRVESAKRSLRTTSEIDFPTKARLPIDIFPLVIAAIVQERPPLGNDDQLSLFGTNISPDRIASRLKALALTHRTLTPLAQRALGQRIVVQNAEQLRALARSPLLGPWTTELLLGLNFPCGTFAGTEEVLRCAAEVLRDPFLSELKHLRIRSPATLSPRSRDCLLGLLDAIGSLNKLEALCWVTPDMAPQYMRVTMQDILHSVCKLKSLRQLAVHNAICGWKGFHPQADSVRFRLEELSLTNIMYSAWPLHETCVSWLLRNPDTEAFSGSSPILRSLTLGYARANSLESVLTSSPGILSQLHSLHLKFTSPPGPSFFSRVFENSSPSTYSRPMSSRANGWNLTILRISCDFSNANTILTEDALSRIPRAVRSLHLTLHHLPYDNFDLCIAQKNELVGFFRREDVALDEIVLTFDKLGPSAKFSWDDINAIETSSRCKIMLKEELSFRIPVRTPGDNGFS